MYDDSERKCHPLLQGERDEHYKNGSFSSSEMATLSSICDVIVQPLPLNSLDDHGNKVEESIRSFATASGSLYPIPNKVTSTKLFNISSNSISFVFLIELKLIKVMELETGSSSFEDEGVS